MKEKSLKSSQWLSAFVVFSLVTSEIFQLTHRYRYQFVGEVMTDMLSIKEMIQSVCNNDLLTGLLGPY